MYSYIVTLEARSEFSSGKLMNGFAPMATPVSSRQRSGRQRDALRYIVWSSSIVSVISIRYEPTLNSVDRF